MQPFKMAGKWWLPESPEKPAYGTLSCSESGELELSLLGTLSGAFPINREKDLPLILGVLDDDKFGQDVSLFDCFVTKFSGAPLGGKETIFANRGYFGIHASGATDTLFSRIDLRLSGLSAWASGFTGFKPPSAPFSVAWEQPGPISGDILGGTILLGAGCSSSGGREYRISERLGLVIKLDHALPARQIEADFVSPLQNLFSFATDHANSVSEFSLTPESNRESAKVVGAATFWDESVAANLLEWSMLFTFEDVRKRFAEVCRIWLDLSRRHQTAFAVYFGSLYRPPGYTDLRFSLLAQAISLYAKGRPNTHALEHPPTGEVSPSVRELLDIHPVVTAEKALATLATEFEDLFAPLVTASGGKCEDFIAYATNTVRYSLMRTPPSGPHASNGSDLYWLCERVAFLFKMAVLSDLGFTSEQIARLLERNRTYRHLRDMARAEQGR